MRPAPSARLPFVLVALAGLAAGALTGCKPGSALHGRYNNFRAYYNTYYNATRKLEEGEASLLRADQPVDRARLVDVFPTTTATGGQSGPFQEAIDKSAELLRNRPTSKWADDALLVIGKAYFYQRNFVGAEQKFRETMEAAARSGDRRLGDEARFWLGRTFAASDRYDDGVSVLEEGLLAEGGDRRWTGRMRLALGELYARAGRWDEAATALAEGAPGAGDADLAARAYLLLGQVHEQAGQDDAAAEAYAAALDQRPSYEIAYAAEASRALVLGLDGERPAEGLEVVRRMLRDDKHYARRGELTLVRARLQAAARDREGALAGFEAVLYDPDLSAGAVRPEAHYRLGQYYRDVVGDYVRASAHFDTAATTYRAPAAAERPSRGAILGLPDEARAYNALAASARQIAEADSLLELGALSPEAFRERIAAIEAERRRAYAEERRQLQAQRDAQAFTGGGAVGGEGFDRAAEPGRSLTGQQGVGGQPAAGGGASEAGFLSYRNPPAVQAGYVSFSQRWGDRPLVPDWRREAAVRASAAAAGIGDAETATNNPYAFGEGPPPLDLSAVPRTPDQREELVTELAGLRYELANAFFLSLGQADTAAALYRTILADTPGLPVATRARYALAEIERAAGRDAQARPLYQAVIDAAPDGPLAEASRARLRGETIAEPEPAAPAEGVGSARYDAARQQWRSGDPRAAAAAFVALGDADPEAPVAPRAYLAAASAYAEWARADTLALTGPLPPDLVSQVLLSAAPAPGDAPPALVPPAAPGERRPPLRPDGLGEGLPTPDDDEGAPLGRRPQRAPDDDEVVRPLPDGEELRSLPSDEPLRPVADDEGQLPRDAELEFRLPAREEVPEALPVPSATEAGEEGGIMPPPVADTTLTLRGHLQAVAMRYPGTVYATRAAAFAEALPEPPPPPMDSLLAAPADSLAGPVVTPPDSLGRAPGDDALPQPVADPDDGAALDLVVDDDALPPPAAPTAESAGLRGDDPLDPEAGGFTWRVQTLTLPDEGASTLRVLQEAGFRAAIVRDVGAGAFVLVLGQFPTPEGAEAALSALPAWAQTRGEVIPIGGLVFDDAETDPRDDF